MSNPIDLFTGTLLFIVPHMDDEVLACGGLLAMLPHKEQIHLVYVTNGLKSPAPVFPSRDVVSPSLGEERIQESINAMALFGIPAQNLSFLKLPEGGLGRKFTELQQALDEVIDKTDPDFIFVPFRYDRHNDHLAINQAVMRSHQGGRLRSQVVEYFVYYRLRLLPLRDIRRYIDPKHLVAIDITEVAHLKRSALDFFASQTTIYYSWQSRPILTPTLLDEECQQPEVFLLYISSYPEGSIFLHSALQIRIAQRLEPILQRWKYVAKAYFNRVFHGT
jgi:LmbE family N-acetylglucosaminyl deacetylase